MTAMPLLGEPLSESERQVLRLVAEGLLNVEIGRRLFLAENTVKTHLRRAFAKLGAVDRANAVWLACGLGLLGEMPAQVPVPTPVPPVPAPSAVAEAWAVVESVAMGRAPALLRGQAMRALVAAGRRAPVRRAS